MGLINKIKGQFGVSHVYYDWREEESIRDNVILLEAGQGKNKNGNMFAFVRELSTNTEWKNFQVFFVVTEENQEEVKQFYDQQQLKVKFVIRNSDEYGKLLATAKYLLTDNSFPPYFYKRSGQIYLNTWHGTPLKTLGKSDIKNAKSLANIQKNYLMCDYALFPNEFTENVFRYDYMLDKIFSGKVLLCDYPRNSVFLQEELGDRIKENLNLKGKKIIAYMPTWRGAQRNADIKVQIDQLQKYFDELDQKLDENEEFYVNLHFLIGNIMDFSGYKHIHSFPSQYETYDFLTACDLLVTDYSSVFFDYAVTKRKVILFPYDYEEYMAERGTYMTLESLPFAKVYNIDQLVQEIRAPYNKEEMKDFLNTYCCYAQNDIPNRIMKLLINNDKTNLKIKQAWNPDAKNVFIFCGNLKSNQINRYLVQYVKEQHQINKDKNYIICFRGKINAKVIDFMQEIGEEADFLALVNKDEIPLIKKIQIKLSNKTKIFRNCILRPSLKNAYQYERNRLFYGCNPVEVINASPFPQHLDQVLAQFHCQKTFIIYSTFIIGRKSSRREFENRLYIAEKSYDKIIDNRNENVKQWWSEEEKEVFYNRDFYIGNIIFKFSNKKKGMQLRAIAVTENIMPCNLEDLCIDVSGMRYKFQYKTLFKAGKNLWIIYYKLFFPYEDLRQIEIQNRINLYYEDEDGCKLKAPIRYKIKQKKGKDAHGPIKIFDETNTSMYFRQTKNNVIYLTIRKKNISDLKGAQIKLCLAYWLARLTPSKKIILLFEKEGSRYEESASVLYEELINQGYNNAYFVLDRNYPYSGNIAEKYRKNILPKGTWKHYYYFFKSKTFLGSEALVHSIDLRISNKYAQRKLADKDKDYVFLQHGVMYMVSLDSESRKFFKPEKLDGKYRVVTSSHQEARHFIDLGGYEKEMIYICGLPKFDRNIRYNDADKIVIMPTWRPWEYNEARYDFEETKYYKMLCRIFAGIPEELHENIIILPHPLFFDAVKDAEFPMKKYFNCETKYDDILKTAKILITDYSSISYDAFYRGCNVIFYWEEKDECLEMYGPSTKLMLNHENAFGDICYSTADLNKIMKENYEKPQKEEYINRYRKLVEFHDGKNTKRLIDLMKADEII